MSKEQIAAWRAENPHRVQEMADRAAVRKREWYRALKDHPCMDCGLRYPTYVMDFDHRPGEIKTSSVGVMMARAGRSRILEEIAKCDLVCANCHRKRTFERGESE